MEKNNWNLNRLVNGQKEFDEIISNIKLSLSELSKYKTHILDNSTSLYNVMHLEEDINFMCERVYVYSYLGYYENMLDKYFQECKEIVNSIYDEVNNKTSFIIPELLQSSFENILKYIDENNQLLKYKFSLEKIFRYKNYTLDEKCEEILSLVSPIIRNSEEVYTSLNNIDISLGFIKDENNKKVELTNSNYSNYLSSKILRVRKSAFNIMYKFYSSHINTISSLYIGKIKSNNFICKARKYDNILSMYLYPDNINPTIYKKLIESTHNNIDSLKHYYDIKGNVLNKKLHMYDLYVNISSFLKKLDYEQAKKIVNEALMPLGNEYLNKFNYILDNNCVDVYPKKAKRSGAYQWGAYGYLPYVSLNFENNVDSLSTLAHEMGHAMHTYYSDTNNDYITAAYPIFLAEIASTVNEILLSNYLINNTSDINEKIYYIVEFLDKFKATVYRQVMFAEFESIVHEKYENNEPLTESELCNIYYKLNCDEFGKSVVVDEDIKFEWARIPHFYTSFYVYKYATGFISALIIAKKLINQENGFKDKYIEFLSSGGSDYPINLLKKLGIDIESSNTLNESFKIFDEYVKLLEKYLNKE